MPEALDAATRALEIDPGSAEAHNALACASLLWERDFNKAEREFLHALALNPKYIQARCWYGLFFLQWTVGRFDEGLAQAGQALEADPLSAYARWLCRLRVARSGALIDALAYAKTAVEHDPQSFVGRWELAIRVSLEWAVRRGAHGAGDALGGVAQQHLGDDPDCSDVCKSRSTRAGACHLRRAACAPRARVRASVRAGRVRERHSATMKRAIAFCAAAVEGAGRVAGALPCRGCPTSSRSAPIHVSLDLMQRFNARGRS